MNYTVHAVMYFYYFLTAMGYRPRWALAVTVAQLSQVGGCVPTVTGVCERVVVGIDSCYGCVCVSQMVVGVAVCSLATYYIHSGVDCAVDRENLKWGIIMYSSYFALFLKFFVERYLLSASSSPSSAKKPASSTRSSSRKAKAE